MAVVVAVTEVVEDVTTVGRAEESGGRGARMVSPPAPRVAAASAAPFGRIIRPDGTRILLVFVPVVVVCVC